MCTIVFFSCSSNELPIEKIKKALKDSPSYSIILDDMKEDGNFFKNYYHKYRVVQEDDAYTVDWLEVPADYYKTNESFLGMSLAGKKDGEQQNSVSPPGYRYVGDSRYGHWRNDSHGGSFWEFYGKYAFFSSLIGGWYRPIYRNDYNSYSRYRRNNKIYYGRNNEFGTNGSIAKKNKPNFYARRMNQKNFSKASFKDKVSQRIGRSRTGFRGRAGGFGK